MRFHIHRWKTVKDNRKCLYQTCRCGERRIKELYTGYTPIDWDWINTGEFKELIDLLPPRPPSPPAPPPKRLIKEGVGIVIEETKASRSSYMPAATNLKKTLIKEGVVEKGTFTLRSGKISNIYINKDKIYCNPELFKEVLEQLMLKIIFGVETKNFSVIVGPEKGGLVLASPLAFSLNKIFAFTEKKEFTARTTEQTIKLMTLRNAYLNAVRNKNILIVEDIITTGGTVSRTIDAVQKAGGNVVGVVCIWSRAGANKVGSVPIYAIIDEKID